jgi:hypothetical protein
MRHLSSSKASGDSTIALSDLFMLLLVLTLSVGASSSDSLGKNLSRDEIIGVCFTHAISNTG